VVHWTHKYDQGVREDYPICLLTVLWWTLQK